MMKRTRTYPNLATYLRDTGETQTELAKRLGISQGRISRFSKGTAQPSLALALRISQATRVPLESLLRVHAPMPNP